MEITGNIKNKNMNERTEIVEESKQANKHGWVEGKWYRSTNGEHIGKFLLKNDSSVYPAYFPCKEYIYKEEYNDRGSHYTINFMSNKEVPLEEIQKYLPEGHPDKIVKEFVLPEKWYIVRTEANYQVINKWFNANHPIGVEWTGTLGNMNSPRCKDQVPNMSKDYLRDNGYTEITFDQFKKYVLKENINEVKEEVRPNFINCKIWIGDNPELCRKVQEKLFELGYTWNGEKGVRYLDSTCLFIWDDSYLAWSGNDQLYFTSDPKREIFLKDLGIKEDKPIEKWSVGSYVVWLIELRSFEIKVGTIDEISEAVNSRGMGSTKLFGSTAFLQRNNKDLKWFPTLQEAQKFSDELLGKTKTNLSIKDLVEGEIYYLTLAFAPTNCEVIFKYLKSINDECIEGIRLNTNDSKVFESRSKIRISGNICKVADNTQKKWLKTCIKQDKFIEQSELDKYDDEGNLIQNKKEFRKGDYIVITNLDKNDFNFPINYCYKQVEDNYYLRVKQDAKGYANGWAILRYDKSNNYDFDWRYATREEIVEYDRLDRPFDITTLNSDRKEGFKEGDWVIVTKQYGDLKEGMVFQVEDSIAYPLSDPNQKCINASKFIGVSCYPWKTYLRRALPHEIPTSNPNHLDLPGINSSAFWVEFKENWFPSNVDRIYEPELKTTLSIETDEEPKMVIPRPETKVNRFISIEE